MRLSLSTVICCCVFTTVLPPVSGTTAEPNTSKENRLKELVQSYLRRRLNNSSVTADQNILVEPLQQGCHSMEMLQDGDAESPPLLSSSGQNVRTKRSSRCFLVTCAYHDLVFRLHESWDQPKKTCVPLEKLSETGYGRRRRRRRRSLPWATRLDLQTGKQRRSNEAAFKVNLAAETEDSSWGSVMPMN
ncbi:uncharacterized protein PAE49_007962 [Odontesthes bonariensis]